MITTCVPGTRHLPVTAEELVELGRGTPDFVYITGDAYVDHPSFGAAIITRVLEADGWRVAVLAQPDVSSVEDFMRFGRPRLGFLVSAGNIDSMVAHYTAAKKPRSYDYYSPGGKTGLRPDRAVIVYCNRVREAYGDIPIVIGGLEASLRRFAHYDYWSDKVRRSILLDSGADLISYGMGETSNLRIARLLDRGVPVKKLRDLDGTVCACHRDELPENCVICGEFDTIAADRKAYADAFAIQYRETDHIRGKPVAELYGDRAVLQNPPSPPLEREELDRVYSLPYTRTYHPSYEAEGGVPAIEEVRFSIAHVRGCFGGCNFCALAFHQGRTVRSRSAESVIAEAKIIAALPDFKGYIHDVGGPTANFRYPACKRQLTHGVCPDRKCLVPKPCPNLSFEDARAAQREYADILSRIAEIDGVKKVFVRSGIRFDYLLLDKSETLFRQLVGNHVSGQLKVAPEHCSPDVLKVMGKPDISVYDRFRRRFYELSAECGLEQYLVPYLISGHPGSTLNDAISLAEYLNSQRLDPQQVQDFYPTPGTASTVMYYTGIDPLTGKSVYIPDAREKRLQRALLQYSRRENEPLVREALLRCGREDLIGSAKRCLIRDSAAHTKPRGGDYKSGRHRDNRGDNRGDYRGEKRGGGRGEKRGGGRGEKRGDKPSEKRGDNRGKTRSGGYKGSDSRSVPRRNQNRKNTQKPNTNQKGRPSRGGKQPR